MSDRGKLDTIRALLAKAERTDNEHERDAYNAKAMEMMARYGIEQAMFSAKSDAHELPTTRVWKVTAPYVTDRRLLLIGIGHSLGLPNICWRMYDYGTEKHAWQVQLTGFKSDLDRADVLWTSLLVQMAHGLAGAKAPWFEDTKTFRKSWMLGFSDAVTRRLKAIERRAASDADTETPGTDLVLVDRRAQVQAAFNAANPGTRRMSLVRRNSSETGRFEGIAAGERADLGQNRVDDRESRRAVDR